MTHKNVYWKYYKCIRKSDLFNSKYYLITYPDIRLADIDPLWHYIKLGWKERRNPSLKFNTDYYLTNNPDVEQAGINPLYHFIKFGQYEGRSPYPSFVPISIDQGLQRNVRNNIILELLYNIGKIVYRIIPNKSRDSVVSWFYQHFGFLFTGLPHYQNWLNYQQNKNNVINSFPILININDIPMADYFYGTIAIHIHMYYQDFAQEFSNYLNNMPFPYDLFISVSKVESIFLCKQIFKELPHLNKVNIKQTDNRGRDLAPMFSVFGEEISRYSFLAHFHTKKSLYNQGATEGWREYLWNSLLGSEERIRKIFSLMQGKDQFGIVYPQNYYLLPYWANTWLANKGLAEFWKIRLGIKDIPIGYFDYPAGSMFWARVDALASLFSANLKVEDFPEETGQTDGTLAHTLERLFVLCSLKNNRKPCILRDDNQPSWSSWRFDQYINRPNKCSTNFINNPKIKVIAFDIFDTLLYRPLLNPETIKKVVARCIGGEIGQSYEKYRSEAEINARKVNKKDVGIDEIYLELGKISYIPKNQLSKIKQLEVETELASLRPREDVINLYLEALASRKPVILLSDMFLPKHTIEKCLSHYGISGWHSLYVSNDVGLRKDSGELYRYVLEQLDCKPHEMLMIGDNERSDIQIPNDMGMSYFHVMRPVEFARGLPRLKKIIERHEENKSIDDEITIGLIVGNNFSPVSFQELDPQSMVKATPYNIGYSFIGPLLASFVNWLQKISFDDSIDVLYFVSRDGKLIKQVYDLWCKNLSNAPKSKYMVISRRAASIASLTTIKDIQNIAKTDFFSAPIESFLFTRYGLQLSNEQWMTIENRFGYNRTKLITIQNGDIDYIYPILEFLKGEIFAKSKKEKQGMLRYLTDIQLQNTDNSAIVDIGYSGSVQRYLNKLLSKKIHGYYMMTNYNARKIAERYEVNLRGCFYENIAKSSNLPVLYKYSFHLEKLISSNEPQIQFYETKEDGDLRCIFRELSADETKSIKIQEELKSGVFDFISDAYRIRESFDSHYQPSCQTACMLLEEFLSNLSQNEEKIFSQFIIDDYYCGRGLVK